MPGINSADFTGLALPFWNQLRVASPQPPPDHMIHVHMPDKQTSWLNRECLVQIMGLEQDFAEGTSLRKMLGWLVLDWKPVTEPPLPP
jgi:hypothetical protein